MKTAEDYIREMESSNILVSRECTFKEYASEIMQFQTMICKMIAGDTYHVNMRIDEALFILESYARKKDLRSNPAVQNCVLTLKKFSKEIAITMSGAKGESLVFRTLDFVQRPNTKVFHNVYITDGQEETELDSIVLTNDGIIILEVKKVKSDLTLTEDGRMVFEGDECYDKMPLAEKMAQKRKLLKKCLENKLKENGLEIPIFVDSFIVFSAPKGQFIRINDKYRREKYCFRTSLNKKIENYLGCAYYNDGQMLQLNQILVEMESNVKRFETQLNYDEVRRNIAEALAVLQDKPNESPVAGKMTSDKQHKPKLIEFSSAHEKRKRVLKAAGMGYAIVSVFAGLLVTSAAAILSLETRHI